MTCSYGRRGPWTPRQVAGDPPAWPGWLWAQIGEQANCLPVCGEDEGGLGLQGSDPRDLLRSGDE